MANESHRISRTLLVTPFLVSLVWYYLAETLAGQSARGFSGPLALGDYTTFLSAAFLLFLIGFGYTAIAWIGNKQISFRSLFALPNRPGWQREFAVGAALGWGMVIVAVLPMAASLHAFFSLSGKSLWLTVVSLATITLGTLATEATFRGYPFRLLIECVGEAWACAIMAVLFAAAIQERNAEAPVISFLCGILLGLVLCISYLRTHALWLPWGLSFAWSASTGVLFGLPVHGVSGYATILEMRPLGLSAVWLTGGFYGPAGALLTPLVLIAGIIVLYRVTRDYAWNYTHPVFVGAGYPMEPPVPAAHAAMEQEAQQKAGALIQIQASTSRTLQVSTPPASPIEPNSADPN